MHLEYRWGAGRRHILPLEMRETERDGADTVKFIGRFVLGN